MELQNHGPYPETNCLVLSFACSSPAGGMLFGVSGLLLLLLTLKHTELLTTQIKYEDLNFGDRQLHGLIPILPLKILIISKRNTLKLVKGTH